MLLTRCWISIIMLIRHFSFRAAHCLLTGSTVRDWNGGKSHLRWVSQLFLYLCMSHMLYMPNNIIESFLFLQLHRAFIISHDTTVCVAWFLSHDSAERSSGFCSGNMRARELTQSSQLYFLTRHGFWTYFYHLLYQPAYFDDETRPSHFLKWEDNNLSFAWHNNCKQTGNKLNSTQSSYQSTYHPPKHTKLFFEASNK